MNVLIVDDEPKIREVIREYCINESFDTIETNNGLEALTIIKQNINIDVMILDIMMPVMDGFQAYEQIKKVKNIPTIMLSARTEEYDKLMGFDLGIDDYLTKPFSPKELIARIKAITNRYQTRKDDKYIYQTLEVDYKGHTVKIDDKEIKLTPKEYELLTYFIDNDGIALSRELLLSTLWGYDFFGDDRTIDTHIKMLRNNLGAYRDLIVTVRSLGYKFDTQSK